MLTAQTVALLLYVRLLENADWVAAVDGLATLVGADRAGLFLVDPGRLALTPLAATAGTELGDWRGRGYAASFVGLLATLRDGGVVLGNELSSALGDALRELCFGATWHRPAGSTLAAAVALDAGRSLLVVLGRSDAGTPFGRHSADVLAQVLPHLQRAARSCACRNDTTAAMRLANVVLDRAPVPLLLTDSTAHVLLGNRRAADLRTGHSCVGVHGGRLCARWSVDTVTLRQAVRRATIGSGSDRDDAQTLVFDRVLCPTIVIVEPAVKDDDPWPKMAGTALVAVVQPLRSEPVHPSVLERLFDLTPAEARLACLLGTGVSLEDAAGTFRVHRGTVRNQLKQIFVKTSTHRQVDLVRVLTSIAVTMR